MEVQERKQCTLTRKKIHALSLLKNALKIENDSIGKQYDEGDNFKRTRHIMYTLFI